MQGSYSESVLSIWRSHLNQVKKSGVGQAEYCRRYGLKPHQLSYWKGRIKKMEGVQGLSNPENLSGPFVSVSTGPAVSTQFKIILPSGGQLIFDRPPEAKWVAELLGLAGGVHVKH
jgi:hypothetical protein